MVGKISNVRDLNPQREDLIIIVSKTENTNQPKIVIATFNRYRPNQPNDFFDNLGEKVIEIFQPKKLNGIIIPQIGYIHSSITPLKTQGSFYIAPKGDKRTLYKVFEREGFGLEADILVQYNPHKIKPF